MLWHKICLAVHQVEVRNEERLAALSRQTETSKRGKWIMRFDGGLTRVAWGSMRSSPATYTVFSLTSDEMALTDHTKSNRFLP